MFLFSEKGLIFVSGTDFSKSVLFFNFFPVQRTTDKKIIQIKDVL